ncbi:hypothetical protein EW146_g2153 [Bondarzewia mesenterica]|uniref:F-box domain-containing protein n=1 Tax=Bondarzewia mesenterica TaxID=1095465 RepID=A0A4S4M1S3_9AGAM|nr:hypothetical protein EW146_g2153 [Bondarzewia mesenterica]
MFSNDLTSGADPRPAISHSTYSATTENDSDCTIPSNSLTIYMPVVSPPTPAPSPRPSDAGFIIPRSSITDPFNVSLHEFDRLLSLDPTVRRQYLTAILSRCTPSELLYISTIIAPLLKRDFLRELPAELALYILSFLDEPRALARAARVSRYWFSLAADESLWKQMCNLYRFQRQVNSVALNQEEDDGELDENELLELSYAYGKLWKHRTQHPSDLGSSLPSLSKLPRIPHPSPNSSDFLYRNLFKYSYMTVTNWRRGGHCLRTHRIPALNPDSGVVTSVALDTDWVVAGLANHRIHVFSAHTGVLVRTLVGHELGVWAVNLVSRGGSWDDPSMDVDVASSTDTGARQNPGHHFTESGRNSKKKKRDPIPEVKERFNETLRQNRHPAGTSVLDPQGLDLLLQPTLRAAVGLDQPRRRLVPGFAGKMKQSDVCGASEGWGQPNALVVSGGCDKVLRVWDINSGLCVYVLQGHTSTVRCLKVLHNRPIAVSGSRDMSLRVWDVQRGRMLRVLQGHTQSVRALDVCGNKVVSGSYDCTCRLWDIDTGECLHVLRGHLHQIYCIAFDGTRIASGGLDTTVRVWDAKNGQCIALLQGHTALVCQMQLSSTLLATGGADGRVIMFDLNNYEVQHRILAHDSSVTALQFDQDFLVTGGNDGRVRLYELQSGNYVREMTEPSESVWKVVFRREVCVITCKRAGKTTVEVWGFRPREVRAMVLDL